MTGIPEEEKPLKIRGLLGVGLDGEPDDVRITRGENFYLYGGTEETHDRMVETTLKFNEKVEQRGKSLPEINARELSEIAHELKDEP